MISRCLGSRCTSCQSSISRLSMSATSRSVSCRQTVWLNPADGSKSLKVMARISRSSLCSTISRIESGGSTKAYDGVPFVNHGYYVEGNNTPTQTITATGIRDVRSERPETIGAYYDLSGRKVSRAEAKKGIYIRNGKKYVIK